MLLVSRNAVAHTHTHVRVHKKSLSNTFGSGTRIHLHFTMRLIELFVILSWRLPARIRHILSSPVTRSSGFWIERKTTRPCCRAIKNCCHRIRYCCRNTCLFLETVIRDGDRWSMKRVYTIHAELTVINYSTNYSGTPVIIYVVH